MKLTHVSLQKQRFYGDGFAKAGANKVYPTRAAMGSQLTVKLTSQRYYTNILQA